MEEKHQFKQKGKKIKANGIEIYYEAFGNTQHPAVLLIMGLDAQCLLWSMSFIAPLVDKGYYVIRFDNRDIGLSTWIENWHHKTPYTLEDMANDTIGLLDALKIKKAHIIGASMGGMIAQRLAITHAERVLSLNSIMSTGHAFNTKAEKTYRKKLLLSVMPYIVKKFRVTPKLIRAKVSVSYYLATYKDLSGTIYPFNKAYFKDLFTYSILERNGQNPRAIIQQFSAIAASGSRLSELKKISVPTLILHGTADKLIPPKHAEIYAPLIPNAKLVWLDGVGHEIPFGAINQVHQEILENLALGNI